MKIHLPKRPTFTCPICGQIVMMYCRRDEWGYVYDNQGGGVLLCSRPCMDEYARRDLKACAERVKKTKMYRKWLLYREGYEPREIAEMEGGLAQNINTIINNFADIYWQELDYIAKEGIA